jgi:uncharacterized repeat protein (TIGR01451 family)
LAGPRTGAGHSSFFSAGKLVLLTLFFSLHALLNKAFGYARLLALQVAIVACAFLTWSSVAIGAPINNTATLNYTGPSGPVTLSSNTTSLNSIPPPTPANVIFYQAAPGSGTSFDFGAGLVEVWPTGVYHINQPVYITLADADRNVDSLVAETVSVTLTSNTVPGDSETLLMQETGVNSGVFAVVIPSAGPAFAVTPNNGQISVATDTRLTVNYQDPFYPSDTVAQAALVDPFGIVFDSVTGAPISGVTVTLINDATGLPATVVGDDGAVNFPNPVVTGNSFIHGGQTYTLPAGGFRFPLVAVGSYRLQLGPVPGHRVPSTVPNNSMANDGAGNPYSVVTGSRGEVFVVAVGPALNIDIPADPAASLFFLQKTVSRAEASAGDFLQYRLELRNDEAVTATAATINDILPPGMRYQAGSLRVNDQPVADPTISADGRTLSFGIGDVAAASTVRVSYVVLLGAGVLPGDAVNTARAAAIGGVLNSNAAQVAVRIREPLFSGRFTIIGRVFEGECGTPWSELKGVANVRVMMEDGTYVITDKDGQYHFEAVRPGTHVVQLDVDSLPPGQEMQSCMQNTRFAGRSFSQFVDVKGGGLWRADFFTRKPRAEIGIRLSQAQGKTDQAGAGLEQRVEVDGSIPVDDLKIMVMLPAGMSYEPGSARVDGKPAPDPTIADSLATFSLGREARAAWKRLIEFRLVAPLKPASVEVPPPAELPVAVPTPALSVSIVSSKLFNAQFDRCSSELPPIDRAALEKLLAKLRSNGGIERVELIGYADSRTLSKECRKHFKSNDELSHARAKALGEFIGPRLGLAPERVRIIGLGTNAPLIDNKNFDAMAKNRSADFIVYSREAGEQAVTVIPPTTTVVQIASTSGPELAQTTSPVEITAAPTVAEAQEVDCPTQPLKAMASFEQSGQRKRTPVAETAVLCGSDTNSVPSGESGTRKSVDITPAAGATPREIQERQQRRAAVMSDVAASGAEVDWFAGQQPGVAWLFPGAGHNPRSPAVRIAIKHTPGQSILLKTPSGEPVDALNFDGTQLSADQKIAVSIWRGVPLVEGDNLFTAEILDAGGKKVQEISQTIHYANAPARAELVLEQSYLRADGIRSPVLAVRFLDRDGKPVRAGVSGPMTLHAPYRSQQQVEFEQTRQLSGMDRFEPQYVVEGDDGIAYIELAPTTDSGTVQLDLNFQLPGDNRRSQELRAWLEPQARDWVVVGFAEGTVGYTTLKDNSQSLSGQVEDGHYSDGQISLYAKGRVLGKWILTMAFDSDKADDRRKSLLGTIDPNEYYTLYGDGSAQRHDAPSQSKLYLKLERGQFYALFGDYETGLTQTQLSRYSRTLNGIKVENGGGPVVFTVFAAETPQSFAHDEIQGDGTSGLYRLTQRRIVLNSEKIRIETRDRLHAEKIIDSRMLSRHIDYDIDYTNGTLFFRQPVNGRDANFNPIVIVAEYETLGVASKELNAGGRIGVTLNEGRVQAGVSAIRDENRLSSTNLAGADLKIRVGKDSELRVEAAQTSGQAATISTEGIAWLTEFEHHSSRYDALLYARRQEPGFGLNQQSFSAAAQQKIGAQGRMRLSDTWTVQGEAYQQENLSSKTTRDAAQGKLRYETTEGGVSVGAQSITDRSEGGALAGRDYRSDQAMLSANRWFMNRKLELSAQSETALGGRSDSVDFPDRYLLGATYAITDYARLLAGQEFTDGAYDTSTSRVGVQVTPWKGARLDSTLNQSQISEYGPRTFAQMGMTQAVLINERWGMDLSVDSSQTFNKSAQPGPVLNRNHPVAAGGSLGGIPGATEDYVAVSTGASYRAPLWSWNGRAETRNGETTDRYGFVSHFLRQAKAGVAFGSSAQFLRTEQEAGATSRLASVDLSWAFRPLGLHWSILDRLELRYEDVKNGGGASLAGFNGLSAGNAKSRRLINNFALNRVSREWNESDREGNLFQRYERNQWSLYYGAKYALDTFDGTSYSGYTDLIAAEMRHDINSWIDVGLHASSLNARSAGSHAYSYGPSIGFSPVTNGWVTLGYNFRGFTDRDFDAARYTAQGIYLQLRFKFDQNTRWGKRAITSEDATGQGEADKP